MCQLFASLSTLIILLSREFRLPSYSRTKYTSSKFNVSQRWSSQLHFPVAAHHLTNYAKQHVKFTMPFAILKFCSILQAQITCIRSNMTAHTQCVAISLSITYTLL